MKTFSLQEYRLCHPYTAAFPTLTQNSDLAVLLGRIAQKRLVRERRAALLRQVRETAALWARLLWSEVTHTRTPARRQIPATATAPAPATAPAHASAGLRRLVPSPAHA